MVIMQFVGYSVYPDILAVYICSAAMIQLAIVGGVMTKKQDSTTSIVALNAVKTNFLPYFIFFILLSIP